MAQYPIKLNLSGDKAKAENQFPIRLDISGHKVRAAPVATVSRPTMDFNDRFINGMQTAFGSMVAPAIAAPGVLGVPALAAFLGMQGSGGEMPPTAAMAPAQPAGSFGHDQAQFAALRAPAQSDDPRSHLGRYANQILHNPQGLSLRQLTALAGVIPAPLKQQSAVDVSGYKRMSLADTVFAQDEAAAKQQTDPAKASEMMQSAVQRWMETYKDVGSKRSVQSLDLAEALANQ